MRTEPALVGHVAALGAPFGLERSAKITQGAIAAERCLMSVHRSALGAEPLARIVEIGAAFALPREVEPEFAAALVHADVVHFGYERGESGELLKIYFEYATRVRAALAAPTPKPTPVHLAFKWEPARPERRAWTRYVWPGCRGRDETEAALARLASNSPRAQAHTRAMLARAAEADAMMLEVEEPGNPRRSWDINLYDADLKLGDALDLVMAAARDFGVNPLQAEAVFAPRRAAALGHVSGGAGRDGGEFLTIYFGVEARGRPCSNG